MQCLASNSEMQVTECFSNLLFSIRTHFAVDSALLEEFSFPQAPFIVATHNICKRVSHLSWTAVTVISRLQFAIQSLGHCGCTMRARNRARRSARMHVGAVLPRALLRAPLRSARTHARTRTHARRSARAHARAPLSARARAPLSAHARNAAAVRMCRSVPCGPCMRRKVRDRTCLGWERA
jgi:hypothetical protein